MLKEKISAFETVRVGLYNLFNIREFPFFQGKHKKHAHELEMEIGELEEMEEVIAAGGRAESSEGSFEDSDKMEEVRHLKKRMQTCLSLFDFVCQIQKKIP